MDSGPVARLFEIFAAILLLIALLPVLALISAAVYRPGRPLLVRRRAVAVPGGAAALLEFNCPEMACDAKPAADARATVSRGILHFLIHTCRGDQLPQLINVLRGDLPLFPIQPRHALFADLNRPTR